MRLKMSLETKCGQSGALISRLFEQRSFALSERKLGILKDGGNKNPGDVVKRTIRFHLPLKEEEMRCPWKFGELDAQIKKEQVATGKAALHLCCRSFGHGFPKSTVLRMLPIIESPAIRSIMDSANLVSIQRIRNLVLSCFIFRNWKREF